jgi:TolA-binding protein
MKRLLILGLMIPAVLFGQKTNDLIIALQRDMSSLQEQMKTLQKSQDEKFAAMLALVQQAVDASSRASASVTVLQREVDTKLTDQQTKLVAPVATLGAKVDGLTDEFRAVSTTVADLGIKINALDTKLRDISDALRTLNTPAPTPPAPVNGQATAPVAANPCAGMSAQSLWESARGDKSKGNLEIAMTEYSNYVKCFHDTANAPIAQFEIGMLYFNGGQSDAKYYEDAVKAFDGVLEPNFPENQKTPDAVYYKAVSLYRADHKTEAGKVFKKYVADYPHGDKAAEAHKNLRNLAMEPAPRRQK